MTPVISVVSVCLSDVCGSHIYCSSMKYRHHCSSFCPISTNPVQTMFSSFIMKLECCAFLKYDKQNAILTHPAHYFCLIRTGHRIKYMLWMSLIKFRCML